MSKLFAKLSAYKDTSAYEVSNHHEITKILRGILQQRHLLSVEMSRDAGVTVTSLLAVDEKNQQLIVDCAPTNVLNKALLDAKSVIFETVLNRIPIFFAAGQISMSEFEGLPALKFAMPNQLIRLQRREFYRVSTSITQPVLCTIPLEDNSTQNFANLPLIDISYTGLALFDDAQLLKEDPGHHYRGCRILLPGIGTLITTLELKNKLEQVLANQRNRRRVGFKFVDLPQSMLAALQRYIMKLEREQNAKTNGLV